MIFYDKTNVSNSRILSTDKLVACRLRRGDEDGFSKASKKTAYLTGIELINLD